VPLRSTHGPGLEVLDPAGLDQPGGHRRAGAVDPRVVSSVEIKGEIPVRADDPKLRRLTPPQLNLGEKFYLPQIAAGLGVTMRHMAGVVFGNKAITVQYPEEQHVPSAVYRGVHRLNRDEQGRVKCVACMLCATACPAHCIDIVGATAPESWPDREK